MRWLAGRIPPVTATQLGLFRVVLACAVGFTLYDLRLPPEPFPRDMHLTVHPLAQFEWVRWMAERPELVARLELTAFALAALFALGVATRLTFATLVGVLTAWTLVRLTHTGAHAWGALLVALWAMLPVRWGDGVGIDALIRRLRGRTPPGGSATARTEYGYALWIPGVVFGAAMFAAAIAKLHSGIGWITNGTVKYFFVIDAARAPTDWGLWVASHHWAAVALSAGAIVTELSLVLAVFIRSYAGRLPFALLGFGLLFGFWAFQHELWYAWWTLYLAFFIPWPAVFSALGARAAGTAAAGALTAPQWVALALVVGVQAAAIVLRIEISPIMSDYPMYSTTYASVEEFERRNPIPPVYRFAVRLADGTERDATEAAERLEIDDVIRDAHNLLREERGDRAAHLLALDAAAERLARHFGEPVAAIVIRIDQRGFDFDQGRFAWKLVDHLVGEYPTRAVAR
ncbi:MAG: hypothetical protein AB1635_01165 [Acidobacteriota bacterium]